MYILRPLARIESGGWESHSTRSYILERSSHPSATRQCGQIREPATPTGDAYLRPKSQNTIVSILRRSHCQVEGKIYFWLVIYSPICSFHYYNNWCSYDTTKMKIKTIANWFISLITRHAYLHQYIVGVKYFINLNIGRFKICMIFNYFLWMVALCKHTYTYIRV